MPLVQGSATQASVIGGYVDLTTAQTVAGVKTFSDQIETPNGSAATPGIQIGTDPDSGLRKGTDEIYTVINGTDRLQVNGAGIVSNGYVIAADGSAANPTLRFSGDPDTGLYRDATKGVVTVVDGVDRINVKTDGLTEIRRSAAGRQILRLVDSSGNDCDVMIGVTSPEGVVTGNPGDSFYDVSAGRLYLKVTGTGNTGWREISPSESGTYTPTGTVVTNLDSVTPGNHRWVRVGSQVFVSGVVTVDPTASGNIVFGLSLPVASNFSATTQASGTGNTGAFINSDSTNDRANVTSGNTATTAYDIYLQFAYTVI